MLNDVLESACHPMLEKEDELEAPVKAVLLVTAGHKVSEHALLTVCPAQEFEAVV